MSPIPAVELSLIRQLDTAYSAFVQVGMLHVSCCLRRNGIYSRPLRTLPHRSLVLAVVVAVAVVVVAIVAVEGSTAVVADEEALQVMVAVVLVSWRLISAS